ncbi:ABC transporter permease [Microlunatus speluncae]|uniref:ABC transporter permease n=1 Tax=Microlunatus speluncae TaxID=2594267 RepID=UPI0012667B2F|nr:ABC transporter permease [Microlunatus speluncae]
MSNVSGAIDVAASDADQTPPESPKSPALQQSVATASQRQLIWWRFRKHKLAMISLVVLALLYLIGATCEFAAPRAQDSAHPEAAYSPPQWVKVSTSAPHLYVNGVVGVPNVETLKRDYKIDESVRIPVGFLVKGDEYKLFGLIPSDVHFFGTTEPGLPVFLLGSDQQGRDLLSRLIYGSRVSLSVGIIGVVMSLALGLLLGGLSGYFGGRLDSAIQRIIEFFISIPTLPLWLGLAAAVPPGWDSLSTYFAITLILSLMGWTGMARVIRSRLLQIRHEDFVLAAELDGARPMRVINKHMLPAFTSHIIASLSLSVPGMIGGETALSFLGLGLQPPVVSWGVTLGDAQSIRVLAEAPWMLFAGLAVVITVMAFNFVGDGLRDAADPYGR